MLDALGSAVLQFGNPWVLAALFGGVSIGIINGALPAGGNVPLLVILMGFAFTIDPFIAMALLVGAMATNGTTDPIPCILMGIPGSASAQATILDGYPMSRQGLAGQALAAAYTASLIGGIVGAIGLLISLPVARELLRNFGSAEFFLLGLMGIGVVGIVSSGAFIKGILTAALGIIIAIVGTDPVLGIVRLTFGIRHIYDGIVIVPAIVGLFAIPELLNLVVSDSPVAKERLGGVLGDVNRGRLEGMKSAFQHKWLVVRSSLIGLFVGMMPGVGGSAAHWLAYGQARMTEKGASQSFGTGDIRGVIAPESANNSIDGGVLIPTLTFGIPGSAGMAVFLGFLVLMGLIPGPAMLRDHLDLTVFIVLTLAVANILAVGIALALTPTLARISLVQPNILVPIVLAMLTVSVFRFQMAVEDFVLTLIFAALGWFMKRYGWPRPPIIIAIVLTPQLEKFLSISINAYGASMLARPQFIGLSLVIVAAVFYMLTVQRKAQQAGAAAAMAAQRTAEDEVPG